MMILTSAHVNKSSPIPLSEFTKRRFEGNITAHKVNWQSSHFKQSFPVPSHSELGISEKSYQALNISFEYLDGIYRATGAKFIPQRHSKVTDHLVGLNFLCDDIFNSQASSRIPDDLMSEFNRVKRIVKLSLMLHDIPEAPGEISTFCQRLPKCSDGKANEKNRQELEHRIAELLLFYSLKAAYNGKYVLEGKVHEAFIKSQDDTQAAKRSAEERFYIVDKFADQIKTDTSVSFGTLFKEDYAELLTAYYLSEGRCEFGLQETWIGNLVKLIDKLESKIHCAVVGDYSIFDMQPHQIIEREYEQASIFMRDNSDEPVVQAIAENLLGLFEASNNVYREWPLLEEPLLRFANWTSLGT